MNTELHPILWNMLVGDEIGKGASRTVYSMKQNSEYVIKICHDHLEWHQNLMEWETWLNVKHRPNAVKKWFAPCSTISKCGRILIQARVGRLNPNKLPKSLPTFLSDFNVKNYGMYEGRVVACDYGAVMAEAWMHTAFKSVKLKKVKWYD